MNRECDVLVIGGAGLVGRHLAAAFDGMRVVTTYHRTPVRHALALDVTDAGAVRDTMTSLRPTTVLLAAAAPHVEQCEREPDVTRTVNVQATRTVADACREVGAKLVVFSSEYVFDGAAGPYREDDLVAPINEYGRQKAEVERIARNAGDHLACRTSGVFGWEPSGKNFVCQLVRRLRAGQAFDVPTDQVITPTYAPDLAEAVARLVRLDQRGTFHVVGPDVLGRVEFARLTARTFGLPETLIRGRPTSELGLRAPRPRDAGLRDDKLRAALGRSLRPLRAALEAMRDSEPSK